MAGSAINWHKAGAYGTKARIYVSNATITAHFGVTSTTDIAAVRAALANNATLASMVGKDSPQPTGQAKERAVAVAAAPNVPGQYTQYASTYTYAASQSDAALAFARQQMDDALSPGKAGFVDQNTETNAMMRKAFDSTNPDELDAAALEAISEYQGAGYFAINAMLWEGLVSPDGSLDTTKIAGAVDGQLQRLAREIAQHGAVSYELAYSRFTDSTRQKIAESFIAGYDQAKRMSAALRSMAAPFAFTAQRAQPNDHPLYAAMAAMSVGQPFESVGFESTSLDLNNQWGSNGTSAVIVDYHIPQGTPGAYLNGLKGFFNSAPGELEWTVPAGARWVVSAKTTDAQGNLRVTLDYLGIGPDPFAPAA